MRDMLVETLKQEGFDPVGTTDGDQAVAHLEEEPFDLLITDIVMPDRDGLETIIECTQRWPRMPIIAISGGDTSLQDNTCLSPVNWVRTAP